MMVIADDFTIINTQGIRFVEKRDTNYGGGPMHYYLAVTYKGGKLDYRYPTEALRDAQFEALRRATENGKSPSAQATP